MTGAGSADGSLEVHVVSHTHWDREWYHPAGRFRQRLVRLIDELLDEPAVFSRGARGDQSLTPGRASFLLDGQAVVLDDFLDIQPERRSTLTARLRDGSIEAGPWYVLADELIPGGEALVRNLLTGRRTLRAFGVTGPPVLYCPDSFGHPAALPSIAAGFGLDLVVVWRGYGGARWPRGDTARWRAPDGSLLILYHLPPSGYEAGATWPIDPEASARRWRALRDVLADRSRTGVVLLHNGADHHARQTRLVEALATLQHVAGPDRVEASSLSRFAQRLVEQAHPRELPVVSGELRDSYGYSWTLQGTISTRAAQKRRNAQLERLLVRDAEPWAALARMRGASSYQPLVHAAWRTVLLTHPHDTLCGCSIDDVARAMDARQDDAAAQAGGVRDDAVLDLVGHDLALAREHAAEWRSQLLVRNRAPRRRGGVVELELETQLAHVPVGPGSGTGPVVADLAPVPSIGSLPIQILDVTREHRRIESPRHYPSNDLVAIHHAVAWLAPVPGYSITPLHLATTQPGTGAEGAPMHALDGAEPVRATAASLVNGLLRLTASAAGLSLESLGTTFRVDDLLGFTDVGDKGDLYTHSSIRGTTATGRLVATRLIHRGPLRGELETEWSIDVPESRASPGVRTVTLPIIARFQLDAGAPFLRVTVSGENRARDHRLRILFRTGVSPAAIYADAAFGPVRRERIRVGETDLRMETPPSTAPLHRYLSLFGEDRGCTVVSDGLAEYEASEDGEIAVTLVRAVGELSRADLPERPGNAGWPVPVPEAQSLGPFAASFALFPHGPRDDATVDAIEHTADDVLLPLVGTTLRSAITDLAQTVGVELSGTGLAFSTLKESEGGEWLVARCVNLLDRPVEGAWRFPLAVREAHLARLDETPVAALPSVGETVRFFARERAIVTVLVR